MTRFVKQKFQWFFDMSTSTDGAQVIKVNAGGPDIVKRLMPFFNAFKNYKLGTVALRMVPAATLPVDPTGLSYEAGESTVDPRDLFNPGLVRITNGEDNVWDQVDEHDAVSMGTYYATMLDPRWFKFRLQNGFKRAATPRFWGIAQLHQDVVPGSIVNTFGSVTGAEGVFSAGIEESGGAFVPHDVHLYANEQLGVDQGAMTAYEGSSEYGFFQTGQKIRMGWLPTQYRENVRISSTVNGQEVGINSCPEIPLITCILPQAYKTKFYYRVYVQETVLFKDPVAINPFEDDTYFYQPADVFAQPATNIGNPNEKAYYRTRANPNDGSGQINTWGS